MNERKTRAALQFMAWLQNFHPDMAQAVAENVGEAPPAGALNQLGESWDMLGQIDPFGGVGVATSTKTTTTTGSDNGAWYSEVLEFAKQAIPAYLAYDAQKDIMDMNIERAKQGLPPIDPGMTAPQVKVIHQLPPEVQTSINDFKMGGMNILLWGALAVGGFFLIRAMR